MSENATSEERLAKFKRFKKELHEFESLFEAAFDELHNTVVAKIKLPGTNVGPHHDYPKKTTTSAGFPSFHEAGFYDDKSPRNYVGVVRSRGLLGALMAKFDVPDSELPAYESLKNFLETHDIGRKLKYTDYKDEAVFSELLLKNIVGSAVEKYLHHNGIEAPIEPKARNAILAPLKFGVVQGKHRITLMVPIALTHFDFDHYRLSESSYLSRIPKRLQLSRARLPVYGSGASKQVVNAATHAFVSNEWSIESDSASEISNSLSSASENELDAADTFLCALRIATGVRTGYAQLLWVPRGWALDYYCDLPPVYGASLRQYPAQFDNFGWAEECPTISAEEMDTVRHVYEQIIDSDSESIRLAMRRLNGCLTRSDPSDAVLDGTIGLELLLGDDQNQSLSYKLRLRTAALSWLSADAEPAPEIAQKVKRLYEARSAIVHGKRKNRSKNAAHKGTEFGKEDRQLAAELLRFVLRTLLANPKYLDPSKIDSELILRAAAADQQNSDS
ncbi:HEPN domain-containing protein [Ahrensia marina]|uniref:HEPN domain-containing protein n=1 Tax=Ahrensia marina TaxID=1514904 RepID=UPI0011874788|nr:HEPN domain-containing protein [Ahrensia marina]